MYEELTNRLNSLAELIAGNGGSDLCVSAVAAEAVREIAQEAANAIEELSKRVPKTPHGDLIDRGALAKHVTVEWFCGNKRINVPWRAIEDAPTIIPASKEGAT